MNVMIASFAVLSFVFVAAGQVLRNRQMKIMSDRRMKISFLVMISAAAVLLADMLVSGTSLSLDMAAMDLMPSAAVMWLLSSSLSDTGVRKWGVLAVAVSNLSLLVFHAFRMIVGLALPPVGLIVELASMIVATLIFVFIFELAFMVRNVKVLMKNGTVWSVVCLTVDVVYLSFLLLGLAFVQKGVPEIGMLVLSGVISAIGVRISTDSKFLLWRKQETLIVESMKLTSVQSASDSSNIEDVYKELYERILLYFEEKKPYLDSSLTVNDLVKDMYSNKLYISKAISQFTGRNFCQFVNYYRVVHSMECFRNNQELKIHELATMNGFNSVVSYGMAFRLFMGETPSEWCRKERGRLLKKGK